MQDVQKVPSAKADGNILSQEIKKSELNIMFHLKILKKVKIK
jgi:hypothetical protein